jgi:chromosome segregation ATPase
MDSHLREQNAKLWLLLDQSNSENAALTQELHQSRSQASNDGSKDVTSAKTLQLGEEARDVETARVSTKDFEQLRSELDSTRAITSELEQRWASAQATQRMLENQLAGAIRAKREQEGHRVAAENALAAYKEAYEAVEAYLHRLRSSLSWRLTAPIRSAARALQRRTSTKTSAGS